MKKILISFLSIFLSLAVSHTAFAAESSLVSVGPNGKLVYTPFAVTGQTNAVNLLPDWAHAGYKGGGVALPDVPTMVTLYPQPGDDCVRIQAAIDQVEAMPLDANGISETLLIAFWIALRSSPASG